MHDPTTGALLWTVDTAGYEIIHPKEGVSPTESFLGADFYRSPAELAAYARRGVVRRKGGALRQYAPMDDKLGLARRLAAMYPIERRVLRPSDDEVLQFANDHGLLIEGDVMPVGDLIYTAKYLHAFAKAIDAGRIHQARRVFNERVLPQMTVRLVGSKAGRPTANWTLEVEPTNLIAAAWLQMARELTQGKRLKKCAAPDCLEWFPDRANKRFCNNRCKMAFHHAEQRAQRPRSEQTGTW